MDQALTASLVHSKIKPVPCPACGAAVDTLREKQATVEIRGTPVSVVQEMRACSACGAEFENSLDQDWRLAAYAKYRAKAGYVTPEQIKQWRAKNGLTQAEVGELLGFGEATLGRYEKGSLQTAANNAALARIMTPVGLIEAINERPDVLPASKRHRILSENALETADAAARTLLMNALGLEVDQEYRGNREVAFDRLVSFVRKLADAGKNKTVLNKLMFYSDFLAYREHGRSISGLCYARLPYGPVPNEYNSLYGVLSAVKVIVIEPKAFGTFTSDVIKCGNRAVHTYSFGEDEAIIRYVCSKFGTYSSTRITEYSHREKAWTDSPPCGLISYRFAEYLRV